MTDGLPGVTRAMGSGSRTRASTARADINEGGYQCHVQVCGHLYVVAPRRRA